MATLKTLAWIGQAPVAPADIPDDAVVLIEIQSQVFHMRYGDFAGGGGGGDAVTWDTLGGKPAVIGAGATAAAARTAIGAGTGNSNLALGEGATQAAAGNHTHADYATTQALADLAARVLDLENAAE